MFWFLVSYLLCLEADIFFFRMIKKFIYSASILGHYGRRGTVVPVKPGIFLPHFLQWLSWEHWDWHPQCNPEQIFTFSLQSFVIHNRTASYTTADRHGHGSRLPASWGNRVCPSHHWLEPHNFSILSECQEQLLWHVLLQQSYKGWIHHLFQWVSGKMFSFILKQLRARMSTSWPAGHMPHESDMLDLQPWRQKKRSVEFYAQWQQHQFYWHVYFSLKPNLVYLWVRI